jgi:hypothetical protein
VVEHGACLEAGAGDGKRDRRPAMGRRFQTPTLDREAIVAYRSCKREFEETPRR